MSILQKIMSLTAVFALCLILPATALDQSDLEKADMLFASNQDVEGMKLVESLINGSLSDKEKSELLWRQSQFSHELTGKATSEGASKDEALAMYQEGMKLASQAIELNSNSPWAYYWRASNLGSWGSTKGIADSLGSLGKMKADLHACLKIDPKHGDAWSVLAIINADVPGVLGGSIDKAVSQDRKGASLWNGNGIPNLEVYGEMANHLIKRDWDSSKRTKKLKAKSKNFAKAGDMFQEAEYFEGSVDFNKAPSYSNKKLSQMSDKEEAADLLKWLISKLEGLSDINDFQQSKLDGFKDRLSSI
jgi:tetratricopeptide (TPR) repeat protein